MLNLNQNRRFRATCEFLSFVCAKERNQIKEHPAAACFFGLRALSAWRLRNSCFQYSNSPRRLASNAQAEGAAKGKVNQLNKVGFVNT